MLLQAIFDVQDEEAAENKSQADLYSDDISETMSLTEASNLATLSLNWSVTYQGMPLNQLPLYPLTISEILRLHLLGAGAKVRESAAKWRFQQRGGYTSEDDPGLVLRVKYPHILRALSVHNVNQLNMGDKLKILTCLINQLLTYAEVRDVIEEDLEEQRKLHTEIRNLQIVNRKKEQEFIANKIRIKKDSKANGENDVETEMKKLEEDIETSRKNTESKILRCTKSAYVYGNLIGSDRAYRRYIKTKSLPVIFVENDERNPGVCLDHIVKHRPDLVDADDTTTLKHVRKLLEENMCNGSDKENEHSPIKVNGVGIKQEKDLDTIRDLTMCTANNTPCPVHTQNGAEWSFYYTKENIEDLKSSLNKRGIRENELKQVLEFDKVLIEETLSNVNPNILNPTIDKTEVNKSTSNLIAKKIQVMYTRYENSYFGYPPETELNEVLHLTLTDNILEMEEKMMSGYLGCLKVKDRQKWRDDLSHKRFDLLDKTLFRKEESQLDKIKSEGMLYVVFSYFRIVEGIRIKTMQVTKSCLKLSPD